MNWKLFQTMAMINQHPERVNRRYQFPNTSASSGPNPNPKNLAPLWIRMKFWNLWKRTEKWWSRVWMGWKKWKNRKPSPKLLSDIFAMRMLRRSSVWMNEDYSIIMEMHFINFYLFLRKTTTEKLRKEKKTTKKFQTNSVSANKRNGFIGVN